MSETVLVLGKRSIIKQELMQGIARSGRRIICAQDESDSFGRGFGGSPPVNRSVALSESNDDRVTENINTSNGTNTGEKTIFLPYTHGSFLSARTLFLECFNKKIQFNHIFLLHSINNQSGTIHNISGQEIESRVDMEIKGFVFLLRESITHFQKARNGVINIVLQVAGPEIPGPFEALVKGSIEGITTSLLTYYSREEYSFRGYRTSENDSKGYADYIVKSLNAGHSTGKWYNYRSKLLSFSRS